MPYERRGKCVVRADTGETVKCHATEEEAEAHRIALTINVQKSFDLFLPLLKVEEQEDGTCLVYTRGAQEVPDVTGQIMDYATTKPNVQKWSQGVFKASQGKSYGNVRSMHSKNSAAGKINEPITFNDEEKAFDFCVKVIDPVDVKKCREGVYTGMSIGGHYAGRPWPDPNNPRLQRYTAIPKEWSLVDRPAIPSAEFQLVKIDGTQELHKFATTGTSIAENENATPVQEEAVVAQANGGDGQVKPEPADVPKAEYAVEPINDKPPDVAAHGISEVNVKKMVEAAIAERTAGDESLSKAIGIRKRTVTTDSSAYADPVNMVWQYDSEEGLHKSITEFNRKFYRDSYSDREWHILGRRIETQGSKLGLVVKYDPKHQSLMEVQKMACPKCGASAPGGANYCPSCGAKVTVEKADPMGQVVGDLRAAAQNAMNNINDPGVVMNALHQILAGIDVATDVSGLNTTPSTAAPTVAAEGAAQSAPPEPKMTSEVKKGEDAPPPSKPASTPPAPEKAAPPASEEAPASTPSKESETVSKADFDEMKSNLAKVTGILESLMKQPQLQKNRPIGNLNVQQPPDKTENELSPLQKSIVAAATNYQEGIGGDKMLQVMQTIGGDINSAQGTAVELVRKSLLSRGFTSQSKIRLLDANTVERIRSIGRDQKTS